MCNEAVCRRPGALRFVSDHLKAQEMCDDAVMEDLYALEFVPDHFKTQEMWDRGVKDDSSSLQFVPDWFVTRQGLYMWHDYCYDDDDDKDKLFEWYDGYKKRKAQKAQIKKELMPIAWHPSRYWDWCMSGDKKQEIEK